LDNQTLQLITNWK